MIKIHTLPILLLLLIPPTLPSHSSHTLSAKIGVGYSFQSQYVLKKFYINPRSHSQSSKLSHPQINQILFNPHTFSFSSNSTPSQNPSFSFLIPPQNTPQNPPQNPKYTQKYLIHASFQNPIPPKPTTLELIPLKPFLLPPNSKSIQFLASSQHELLLTLSFRYPNTLKKQFTFSLQKPNPLQKQKPLLINFPIQQRYTPSKPQKPIQLLKIKILKKPSSSPHIQLSMSPWIASNLHKNPQNQPLHSFQMIQNFEKITPTYHWQYLIQNQSIPQNSILKISPHSSQKTHSNQQFLSLLVPTSTHNNSHLIINFFQCQYKIFKHQLISLWLYGYAQNEELSLILRDSKSRFFELVLSHINFFGWKKITSSLPSQQISFSHNPQYPSKPYLILAGIKITPKTHSPIQLGIDQIFSHSQYPQNIHSKMVP